MPPDPAGNPLHDTRKLGQSVWYDNVSRGLLRSGELAALIDGGVTGLTSNPTIFEKAISGSGDYDDALLASALAGRAPKDAFEQLAMEDIRAVADLLRPVYDATGGADGFASLEVSPNLAHDTEGTVAEAQRLFAALDRPNVMVKVPGTPEGVPAVRRLIGQGVNVNVTLLFHREAYAQVRDAYVAGLEQLAEAGGDLGRVASVASFFVSRVDVAVDALLEQSGGDDATALMGKAAIANAALAYRDFRETAAGARFAALAAKGARAQRPLWASTGTKNPDYSDVLYIESLIAPDTVNTMPPATLTSFLEHGRAAPALEPSIPEAERVMAALEAAGVDMTAVTATLLADGVKSFADSFTTLLANVEQKQSALLADHYGPADVSLGAVGVDAALSTLAEAGAAARIAAGDHTLWKPDPTEIADRLGWLTLPTAMLPHAAGLLGFADDVQEAGVRHVVLLGMGGSSLGAEALRSVLAGAPDRPVLIVLDTTVPAWVSAAADAVDPARTMVVVSSKSGGTLETLTGYRYFRARFDVALGDGAGRRFVAVTDPGTPLERLAREEGFLRTFPAPETVGGRYSVLSDFGLAPAALAGVDVGALLARAARMQAACAPGVAPARHPGLWLGAVMAAHAQAGRDKLTLLTSPALAGFGAWAEQLIAESLGKEGRGIVPVAGEPLDALEYAGDDRLYVALLDGGDDDGVRDAASALAARGEPVVTYALRDRLDIAAEFYRWEYATAAAGALLGVNPFDQPNVQSAKDTTSAVLRAYADDGALPAAPPTLPLRALLDGAAPGDYVAVMAYLHQTPETDAALAALRTRIARTTGLATTVGYGPRFLHSTGQLHKGGPATGIFLQITADHPHDLDVPGESYTFGTLADAQALGDLQALQALGRRVARVHCAGGGVAEALERLP